ncbi:Uu.00g056950.m01.CDS01 [Anthostomella pinea]|uniref:Coronin n=1 Tax=Anthostomella pinea TaxID=933095 RepID=A0AAI8VRL0_9PEZI|nr:Uu.00g056950.m01.CDS01 [Anthostomella pinea]
MSGRFVRASKYRHVFGKPTRKEFCYDNLRISRNAWDTNLVKANPEYLAVNWEASGGGAFAVIPLNERGKVPDVIPLFRGHTATVLDTDWNPFNDRLIASASDDGKVMLWQVPQGFTLLTDAEEPADVAPVAQLKGHSRKVGQVVFNPAAENILASASGDLTIKLWDVGAGAAVHSLKHTDIVQSLSWNASGSMLVTTSRDKKLRVWDVRQERPAHESPGHEGAKSSRVVWLGEQNRFATTGFSKMSDRQLALWEPGNPTPIGGRPQTLDSISGVCMPFWDDSCNTLYLAGKGDGNIRYFEYESDKFEFLSEYKSPEPQRGIAFLPKRGVNVHENEVMRAYKTVNDSYIEPISFTVPRRAETFQSDIYPPCVGAKPAVSAHDWLSGKTGLPPKIDFESIYEGNAPVEVPSDYKPPAPTPAPALVSNPAPKKEPEPAPAPAAVRSPPPSMQEQNRSMAAMASKYEDNDDEDDADETSSFEEVSKPPQRSALPARSEPKPSSPTKTTSAPPPKAASPVKSPTYAPTSTSSAPVPTSSSSATTGSGAESTLEQIKQLLETQTKMLSTQGQQINHLTTEVDYLKKRVGSGSQDQSERIRQLELELEELRS